MLIYFDHRNRVDLILFVEWNVDYINAVRSIDSSIIKHKHFSHFVVVVVAVDRKNTHSFIRKMNLVAKMLDQRAFRGMDTHSEVLWRDSIWRKRQKPFSCSSRHHRNLNRWMKEEEQKMAVKHLIFIIDNTWMADTKVNREWERERSRRKSETETKNFRRSRRAKENKRK